jgi:hypothetical protein
MKTNPFAFLVGCPRSGTTLLQRMVGTHRQIAVAPEVAWIARRYEDRVGLTADGLVTPAFVAYLLERGSFGRYTPLPISPKELEDLASPARSISYAQLVGLLFERYGELQGKPLVANKTVDHVRHIATLHELWPQARFVHLIRDGRDVALSAISWRRAKKLASRFPSWRDDPVSTAAAWWEWHVRPALEAGSFLGPDLYHEVRYEPLVAQPERELKSLCTFLTVPYDDAMLRFHEGRKRPREASDAKHAWLPPTPRLRAWRSQMAPDDVERFEALAGELLGELGYSRGAGRLSKERLEHAVRIKRAFEAAAEGASTRQAQARAAPRAAVS